MLKNIIYFLGIILVFLVFLIYNKNYPESFIINKKCVNFQHNKKIMVNKESYKYVYQVRQQILNNIDKLLNKLNIKYVISHGNLIEYTRGKKIYHDDDIDIRMDINDLDKWISYCKNLNSLYDYDYNLKYDNRIFNWRSIFSNLCWMEK